MKTNLGIDLVILLLFLVGFEPALTGGVVHEWLNLVLAAGVVVHLVMHWGWIRTSLRPDVAKLSRVSKVNLVLNIASFAVIVAMILSGLMISRYVLGTGTPVPRGSTWRELHETLGNLLFALIAFHFALHWNWLAHACTRYLPAPLGALPWRQLGRVRRLS